MHHVPSITNRTNTIRSSLGCPPPRVGDSHGQLERVLARESERALKRRKRAPSLAREEATPKRKEAVASPPPSSMSFLPSVDRIWLGGFVCSTMGVSVDNIRGLVLALSSSLFIGSSFIVKKKGLKRAGVHGVRAGSGGFSYLYEPLWWVGMLTMILGEAANFAAYAFAPAILVTPLGALSIIVSAVLAHFFLNEKLHIFGILGCVLCVVGSVSIVLHAPIEKDIESVKEVWYLATEPGFIVYFCVVMFLVVFLIFHLVPRYGQTNLVVYVGICSLMGSLTVMSVKAVGIALKLTLSGMNQFVYAQTWFFTIVVAICCLMQMNYLNKALDTFNTAVISPVYYVMFTTLTIFASMIMFKDWASQNASQIVTEICGFVTILSEGSIKNARGR
ncbi:hypothetical protein OPV22_029944 [Ensete ventricosum]|uniref:Probable magnesium transporter n=1 Tax=Ensete ventricosum TaxID=4639 RepID=A0AAV8Q2I5_ENSVE|nr:hypothetical protein OPV22_029944 [Ensete ventricosum]